MKCVIALHRNTCSLPQLPRHATVSHETATVSVNTIVTYRCNDGYNFDGLSSSSFQFTCDDTGTLLLSVPQCLGK